MPPDFFVAWFRSIKPPVQPFGKVLALFTIERQQLNEMAPLQYPMLESCRVTIKSSVIDLPPVRLPSEILQAVGSPSPSSYDFSLEQKILKKKEEREKNFSLTEATSREELEQNALARIKSVTHASDDVCISLLKSNSYDIKESIEAFLTK